MITLLPALLGASMMLATGTALGLLLAKWMRLPYGEALAFALGFPCRNVAFGLTVAASILHKPEYLAILLVYFLLEVPLVLAGTMLARKQQEAAGMPEAEPEQAR